MFHACAARFDVTVNLEIFYFWGELNKTLSYSSPDQTLLYLCKYEGSEHVSMGAEKWLDIESLRYGTHLQNVLVWI